MSMPTQNELIRFRDYLAALPASQQQSLSPEEAVGLWRAQEMTAPSPKANGAATDEHAQSVAAIREAIADMQGGDRGIPFDEFAKQVRGGCLPGPRA